MRLETDEAIVLTAAQNFYEERGVALIMGLPWAVKQPIVFEPPLRIEVLIKPKVDHVQWSVFQTLYISAHGQTNLCTGATSLSPPKDITREAIPIPKRTFWKGRYQTFMLSFWVDPDPSKPFTLHLKGLECDGREILLPPIEFSKGKTAAYMSGLLQFGP